MKEPLVFSVGILARIVAVIVEKYAAWLLEKVGNGAELGLSLLEDLRDFGRWLLQWASSQLCGRRTFAHVDYDDDFHHRFGR